jgi:hypothetical protein
MTPRLIGNESGTRHPQDDNFASAEDRVWIEDQRYRTLSAKGLYVIIAFLGDDQLGGVGAPTVKTDAAGGVVENTSMVITELFQVALLSGDDEAYVRRHEPIMAIHSALAQQRASDYAIRFDTEPAEPIDVSFTEMPRRMNKYVSWFRVFRPCR